MEHEPTDHSWNWYADKFCRDIRLCHLDVSAAEAYWYGNRAPDRVVEIAQYYLDHPEFSRDGREMLLGCVLESADERLRRGPLTDVEGRCLRAAVERGMFNLYDRDIVRDFWEPGTPGDEQPISQWIKAQFPGWEPPPSVWSRPDA